MAWREQNLAPRIEDLVVAPQGQGFREGELLPAASPITQTLPSGQKVEYSLPPTSTPRTLRDLPDVGARAAHRPVEGQRPERRSAALPDRGASRGKDAWIEIGKDLEATAITWDTSALPDGRYRLRVSASDEVANPVGEERTAEAQSEPFTIDNSPPSVTSLDGQRRARRDPDQAHAEDGVSPLSRLEVAVDDGDWRTSRRRAASRTTARSRSARCCRHVKPAAIR